MLRNIKRYATIPVVWFVFGLGLFFHWLNNLFQSEIITFYPIYNRLMILSSELQDYCGYGPWRNVDKYGRRGLKNE